MKQQNENQPVLQWLYEQFPHAFSPIRAKVKPLQLGIMEDILDIFERLDVAPFSKKRLRQGLNFYTSTRGYLESQKEGAFRVDLFGQAVEPVDAAQAAYAQQRLVQRSEAKPVSQSAEPAPKSEM